MVTDTLYSFDITIIITAVIIIINSHRWGHAISYVMGHEQKYVTSGWEQRKVRHENSICSLLMLQTVTCNAPEGEAPTSWGPSLPMKNRISLSSIIHVGKGSNKLL